MKNQFSPRILLAIGMLIGIHLAAKAQIIQRQYIGTLGGSFQNGSLFVQQSIGQPFQTSGFYKKEFENRPGFIQAQLISIEPQKNTFKKKVIVYPNPSVEQVDFMFEEGMINLHLQVFGQDGTCVMQRPIEDLSDYTMDCTTWSSGVYVIYLTDEEGNIYYAKLIKQ